MHVELRVAEYSLEIRGTAKRSDWAAKPSQSTSRNGRRTTAPFWSSDGPLESTDEEVPVLRGGHPRRGDSRDEVLDRTESSRVAMMERGCR